MKQELQVSILKELMRQIDEGKNVDAGVQYRAPVDSYVCPEIAKQEWQQFFQNHTQLIGLSGDLPKPGSYFTVDDFGTPVLATRDKDGTFRAFVNACRHRGVRVTKEERGEAVRFSCPFHAWTYSNQGDLLAIPQEEHFGGIDKSCHGLVALPAEERDGLLWVHPQPDGVIDLDRQLGPFAEEIASGNFGELVRVGESVIDKNLNWKFANDTFGETYHFQKLHRNTLGQLFYGDNLAYEAIGKNHRFVFASKAIDLMRNLPEDEWRLGDGANLLYYLFPNIQFNVGGGGNVSVIKIYPVPGNPSRSITRVGHYFPRDVIEQLQAGDGEVKVVDGDNVYDSDPTEESVFDVTALVEVFDSTIEQEDYAMGETAQQTIENGLVDHFIFGRNEPALHHYHSTFRRELGLPPLERVA